MYIEVYGLIPLKYTSPTKSKLLWIDGLTERLQIAAFIWEPSYDFFLLD